MIDVSQKKSPKWDQDNRGEDEREDLFDARRSRGQGQEPVPRKSPAGEKDGPGNQEMGGFVGVPISVVLLAPFELADDPDRDDRDHRVSRQFQGFQGGGVA